MYVHTIIVYFTSYSSIRVILWSELLFIPLYTTIIIMPVYMYIIACILVCYIYLNYYIVLYSVITNLFLFFKLFVGDVFRQLISRSFINHINMEKPYREWWLKGWNETNWIKIIVYISHYIMSYVDIHIYNHYKSNVL